MTNWNQLKLLIIELLLLQSVMVFPYTKDQPVTGLLQPCLACHVSVSKLYNRQQGIYKVYTDFPLIVIAEKLRRICRESVSHGFINIQLVTHVHMAFIHTSILLWWSS